MMHKLKSNPVVSFSVFAALLSIGLGILVCMVVDTHSSLKSAEEKAVRKVPIGLDSNKVTEAIVDHAMEDTPENFHPSVVKTTSDKSESASLYWKGRELLDAEKHTEAISYFTKSLKESEKELARKSKLSKSAKMNVLVTQSWCWQNRGFCKLMLKDYKGAIPDLTLAIQRSPSYKENYVNRAEAYRLTGQRESYQKDLAMVEKISRANTAKERRVLNLEGDGNGSEPEQRKATRTTTDQGQLD